jgi:hypothetical protein
VLLAVLGHVVAKLGAPLGLAGAGDVVELAFDGEVRGGADVLGAHTLQLAFRVAHVPGAVHEVELLEHHADGVEVVVRIHVEHGVVLVVELAVRLGAGVVARDQVLEVVVVAGQVAVRVHRHEAECCRKPG